MISSVLYLFATTARAILFIYCLLSWFRLPYDNKFVRFIYAVCDPVLNPIRKLLSKIAFLQNSPIDFSPLVLMLLISFVIS